MFDVNVYSQIATGCLRSAEVVVPEIVELLHPRTVIDIGCGQGWWLSVFAAHGCEVTGIDGDGVEDLAIPAECFEYYDLARAEHLDVDRFDLAVSLEVAEHLPPERADWFVDELCSHSRVVLFSAAIPRQGGNGHINEQWPSYWIPRFTQNAYVVSGNLRWRFWHDERVEFWYAQNLMLAVHVDELAKRPELASLFDPKAPPVDVIHPTLWSSR